jgi:hypothetical protein
MQGLSFKFTLKPTYSTWNGITVGSAGTLANINGRIIGPVTGDLGQFNGLYAPPDPFYVLLHVSSNFACASGSASCSVTVPSTTSGSYLFSTTLTGTANHFISSASGGGGSWVECPASGCRSHSASNYIDMAYNITGTGGATSISTTLDAAPGVSWAAIIDEYRCLANCGTLTFDAAGTPFVSASCTTACVGPTFSNLKTDDFILAQAAIDNGFDTTAFRAPYTADTLIGLQAVTSSGTAAVYTQTPAGATVAVGMAFK